MDNTTLSPQDYEAMAEVFKGLFSEEMAQIVTEAPTDRYLIYTFLVIAVVLIGSVILILKITTSATSKTVKSAVEPYMQQLTSFEKAYSDSMKEYNTMQNKFDELKEELIRFQTLRAGEEDLFAILRSKFDTLGLKVGNTIDNISTIIREHEKNSFERHMTIHKLHYEIRMFIIETKHYCGIPYAKSMGERLVDKGVLTSEELTEFLEEENP